MNNKEWEENEGKITTISAESSKTFLHKSMASDELVSHVSIRKLLTVNTICSIVLLC